MIEHSCLHAPHRRLAALLPLLLASASSAEILVEWDIPSGTAATALITASEPGVGASVVSRTGLSVLSASTLWRTYGYNDTERKGISFSITASPGSTVTLESLILTANAQAGSAGEWTNPELTLEYSTDPEFGSVTEAGTLDLGPDLANATGDPFTADSATFFGTDLVINPGETYYFRLVGLGASAATGNANRLSYNSAADMQLNGTVVSSAADLVWNGADGDNWNSTEIKFLDGVTPATFQPNDNVTIATAGAINIDAAGITAGILTDTNPSGTATLQNGNLTTTGLVKSGAGTLSIASPVALDTGLGSVGLSGGTLQVSNGASLSTSSLALSGGATLQVDLDGTFTSSGANTLETGGAILQNDAPVTLEALTNSAEGTPFTKQGTGELTLSSGLGIRNTGPTDFDILAGTVVATGTGTAGEINTIGTNTFDGDLVLSGSTLMLHGSTVSGSGTIFAQSESSSIAARFNRGTCEITSAIVLDTSDLKIDSPNGGNLLILSGPISGENNLVKVGNGTATLGGTNSYFGTTTVDAGFLRVGNGVGGTLGEGDVILNVVNVDRPGTIDFRRDDALVVPNLISGEGNVVVNCGPDGSVELAGDNGYTGITIISGGTLVAPVLADADLPSSIGLTDGSAEKLILRGGATLSYTGPAASTDREFSLGGAANGSESGGGTISVDGSGPLVFSFPGLVGADGEGTAPRILTLAGSAPGTSTMALEITDGIAAQHSVVKSGSTTWELTGINSYTGPTTVEEGTLILANADLADSSTVSIAKDAVLDLTHGTGDTIDALFIDGVQVASGSYGGSASAAAIKDDLHFNPASTGYLIVTSDPVANDYDDWAGPAGYDLTGGPDDDDDQDGLSNREEYAFGLDPTSGSSVSPVTAPDTALGTFTYTRRNPAIHPTGLSYSYGSSTTLVGAFVPFVPVSEAGDDGDPVETVTVTIPAELLANPSLFVQVTAQ